MSTALQLSRRLEVCSRRIQPRVQMNSTAHLQRLCQPAPARQFQNTASLLRVERYPACLPACRARCITVAASGKDEFEVDVKVQGMMCEGCASTVTAALKGAKGVSSVNVDLPQGIATVGFQADSMMEVLSLLPACVDAVKAAGFDAEVEFNEKAPTGGQ